jgi:protein-tyrosine phosphatase
VDSFLRRRKIAWEKLTAVKKNEYPIIKLGAEVLICNNIDKMPGIEDLCLENSNVILIEMPLMKHWDINLIETVVRLRDELGLEVILAHGERYPVKETQKLLEKGFQVQLNVSSIGKINPSHFAMKCIKGNYVAAFGSDIHGLYDSYKFFTKAMKKLGLQAEKIMERTRILLAGK